MKERPVLYGVVGLLAGVFLVFFINTYFPVNSYPSGLRMMGPNSLAKSQSLTSLKGDEFDKGFLAVMISHHQAALEMSILAKSRASHSELKSLAESIISTQEKEIDQMEKWQKDWGYLK